MRETHIISTLEEKSFDNMTDDEMAKARSHIAGCDECKSAYDAARIASRLIQARAAETVEVNPFFKTRVMAAIRERHLSTEEPALVRMWRAAGAMVSTMALMLVILTGMTIFSEGPDSQVETASENLYSAEYVVLMRGEPENYDLGDEQVVSTIYDLEDSDEQ
jgi:predicted anti-sigma-YlaC factor YlaD